MHVIITWSFQGRDRDTLSCLLCTIDALLRLLISYEKFVERCFVLHPLLRSCCLWIAFGHFVVIIVIHTGYLWATYKLRHPLLKVTKVKMRVSNMLQWRRHPTHFPLPLHRDRLQFHTATASNFTLNTLLREETQAHVPQSVVYGLL